MMPQSAFPVKLNTNGPRLTPEEEIIPELPNQQLTQDDFMALLVTQLSNQDPLNPNADMDYFAQMAQFANLEQNKELGTTLQRIEANSLIGKTVEIDIEDAASVIGSVDAIRISAGKPKVMVGGVFYDLEQVRNVLPAIDSEIQSPEPTGGDSTSKK